MKNFFLTKIWNKIVLNEDSYYLLRDNKIPVNSSFPASQGLGPSIASPEVCFTNIKRFLNKFLIWMTKSECGFSQPFFAKPEFAARGDTCRNICILTILDTLLKEYHARER